MRDRSNMARGRWGEDLAVRHLERRGLTIIERNWRSAERHVQGELDVIAHEGDLVVFCEVKARRRAGSGGAAAAVDDRKQLQIRRLAESWIRSNPDVAARYRFDVVAIDGVRLAHFEAAF